MLIKTINRIKNLLGFKKESHLDKNIRFTLRKALYWQNFLQGKNPNIYWPDMRKQERRLKWLSIMLKKRGRKEDLRMAERIDKFGEV